jgi:hypothetical protein
MPTETADESLERARKMMEESQCKCGVCFANLYLKLRSEANAVKSTTTEEKA